jgi:hypothetical protein
MSKLTWKLGLVLLVWGCTSSARSGGWYHMPCSACQCMGWGFGPGYHAPLLLGPRGCIPTRPQKIMHLPATPCGVGVGCGGCDPWGMSQLVAPQYMPAPFEVIEPMESEAQVLESRGEPYPSSPLPPSGATNTSTGSAAHRALGQ